MLLGSRRANDIGACQVPRPKSLSYRFIGPVSSVGRGIASKTWRKEERTKTGSPTSWPRCALQTDVHAYRTTNCLLFQFFVFIAWNFEANIWPVIVSDQSETAGPFVRMFIGRQHSGKNPIKILHHGTRPTSVDADLHHATLLITPSHNYYNFQFFSMLSKTQTVIISPSLKTTRYLKLPVFFSTINFFKFSWILIKNGFQAPKKMVAELWSQVACVHFNFKLLEFW